MSPPRQKHISYAIKAFFSGHPLEDHEMEGRTYVNLADRVYVGEQRFVRLACGRICLVEKGAGPTVLLLHGLGAHIGRWSQTITELSKDYHVIAVDLPGFGKSEKGHDSYSVRFYARMLRELIDKLELKNLTVIGHSLGGATVLRYLIEDPGPVVRVGVVAPAGIRIPQHRMLRSIAGIMLRSPFARGMLAKSLKRCAVQKNEAVIDMIFHALGLPDDPEWKLIRHTLQNAAANLMHFTVHGELSVIQTPMLVVWGEDDSLLPADLALKIHHEVPLARLAIIPECGHYPMLERPELFHKRLREFLENKEYIEGCEH